jgi:hypothetical protein
MIVKNINGNTKDIFFGDTGWDTWGRVEKRRGVWVQATTESGAVVGSSKVPAGIIAFLNKVR